MSKGTNEKKQSREEKPTEAISISLRDLIPFVVALLQTAILPFILIIVVLAFIGIVVSLLLH
ncbi:MAG: hypothetical protein ABSF09_13005 [Candidatus Bathyarchaeia archaeon]